MSQPSSQNPEQTQWQQIAQEEWKRSGKGHPPTPPPAQPVWAGQPAAVALLAQILTHAAMELFDAAALTDRAQMWEEARAIASRILAATPL